MSAKPKLVIPGGSGLLGRILAPWFVERGWEVTVLSRRPAPLAPGVRGAIWNGESLGDWARELEGAAAVVNLAGRSVNCRYNRRESSRDIGIAHAFDLRARRSDRKLRSAAAGLAQFQHRDDLQAFARPADGRIDRRNRRHAGGARRIFDRSGHGMGTGS